MLVKFSRELTPTPSTCDGKEWKTQHSSLGETPGNEVTVFKDTVTWNASRWLKN